MTLDTDTDLEDAASVASELVTPDTDMDLEDAASVASEQGRMAAPHVAWIGTLSFMVALLAAFAWLLVGSDAHSERQLEQRFEDRGALAARYIRAYVADVAALEGRQARQRLSGEVPSRADFERIVDYRFQAAVLLDGRGHVLQAWPYKASVIGKQIAPAYPHLQAAIRTGRISVSNVVLSAVAQIPVVAIATPYETPNGRRVFSGAFDLQRSPLGVYLDNYSPIAGSAAYVIDAHAQPLAASGREALRDASPSQRRLFVSAAKLAVGGRHIGADYVVVQTIEGTPWRMLTTVPTAELLAPVNGFASNLGWALLALFAATCVAALVLLQRLRRTNAGLAATGTVRERLLHQERDQTDRLRELDRMKDEFVALASHELRTPLTSIGGYMELLLDEEDRLEPDQQAFLHTIRRNSDRVLRLVNDLLDLSRIENRELSLDMRSVSLPPVAHEAIHEHTPMAAAKEITLTGSIPETLIVTGDLTRLRQVIDNLLSNAIKYTPAGGHVEIKLMARMDGVELTVSDDGPGIPEHERVRLFEPFFRASAARDQHIQGTGLGLAISKAIVLAHGGLISITDLKPGTAFIVTLPRPAPRMRPHSAEPQLAGRAPHVPATSL